MREIPGTKYSGELWVHDGQGIRQAAAAKYRPHGAPKFFKIGSHFSAPAIIYQRALPSA